MRARAALSNAQTVRLAATYGAAYPGSENYVIDRFRDRKLCDRKVSRWKGFVIERLRDGKVS